MLLLVIPPAVELEKWLSAFLVGRFSVTLDQFGRLDLGKLLFTSKSL
jgi:hypothetical protein